MDFMLESDQIRIDWIPIETNDRNQIRSMFAHTDHPSSIWETGDTHARDGNDIRNSIMDINIIAKAAHIQIDWIPIDIYGRNQIRSIFALTVRPPLILETGGILGYTCQRGDKYS